MNEEYIELERRKSILQEDNNNQIDTSDYVEGSEQDKINIDNQLKLRQWEIEPYAQKGWDDISKDSVLGNLDFGQSVAISLGEDFYSCLEALRSIQSNEYVANYFLPDSLLDSVLRKKASILALSNSKEGFLRKLLRTTLSGKSISFEDDGEIKFQPKFWGKKKSKSNGGQIQ